MGNRLFNVDIAKLINDNVGGTNTLDAVLTKRVAGTRTPGQLTGGTNPTETTYNCKGFIDSQAIKDRDGNLIDDGTKTVVLIGDSINGGAPASAPKTEDLVTIESTVYIILGVDRDPAAATYTLMVRER